MNYSIFDFYQLNYLLIVITSIKTKKRSISKSLLIDICSLHIIGGRSYDYEKAVKLASLLNLISERNKNIRLSKLGNIFLSDNPNNYYELTNKQKDFVIKNYMFQGVFFEESKTVFSLFCPDYENETYYLNKDEAFVPKDIEPCFNLLKSLGVLIKLNSFYVVSKAYVKEISKLLSPKLTITSKNLLKKLELQKKLGDHAENLVLKFEINRLKKKNCKIQAQLVRKISVLNEAAGYDIESFNGNDYNIQYDRFIEVKSSSGKEIRFLWTRNQHDIAQELKDKYWIYYVGNLSLSDEGPVYPIMFQNPVNIFTEDEKFVIEPAVFLIRKN